MEIIRLTPDLIVEELRKIEERFGMPAAEFYDRYRMGEVEDSVEVVHAAGICYMALRNGVLTPQTIRA